MHMYMRAKTPQAQLSTLQASLADAERRVYESELIRRKLHNTIQARRCAGPHCASACRPACFLLATATAQQAPPCLKALKEAAVVLGLTNFPQCPHPDI
jgi:hypothetical protein